MTCRSDSRFQAFCDFAKANQRGKEMFIPKKFKLGAVTWTVEEVVYLPDNTMGLCNNLDSSIKVLKSLKQEVKEQTFCHELIHALLYSTGRTEHDEQLVDSLAVFLHQYLKQK
jgi:hypothetical protein